MEIFVFLTNISTKPSVAKATPPTDSNYYTEKYKHALEVKGRMHDENNVLLYIEHVFQFLN